MLLFPDMLHKTANPCACTASSKQYLFPSQMPDILGPRHQISGAGIPLLGILHLKKPSLTLAPLAVKPTNRENRAREKIWSPPKGSFESMRHQATHPRTPVFRGAWTQQHVGLALSGDFCVIGVLCQGFRRDAADLGACLTPCEEYVATRSSIEIRSDPRAALFSSS